MSDPLPPESRSEAERLARQRSALIALANNQVLGLKNLRDLLRGISETAASTLKVERASLWRFTPDRSALVCSDLFEPNAERHSSGFTLEVTSFPNYFRAITERKVIAADDAVNNPHTREFAEAYLGPLGIGAVLDVPINSNSVVEGVLSFEHVGQTRPWKEDEKAFALAMGNLISLALEQEHRRQAEAALQTSEAQLSNAMTLANLGHWEYDPSVERFTFSEHFYKLVRTTAEREGGYTMSPAEYVRRFLPPEVHAVVAKETQLALETTDPSYTRQLEHPIVFGDGQTGFIAVRIFVVKDDQGRTIKTYGVNQDITERKQAEMEIRHAERRFRSLIEHSADGIRLLDRDEQVVYASPSVRVIEGYDFEEVLGRRALETTHPEDRSRVRDAFEKVKAHPGLPVPVSWRCRHKDGHWLWLEGVVINLLDDPAVGAIVNNYRDVTERRHLEEQLLVARKLEAIGQLAGGIAHDFNNLLTVIQGHATILVDHRDSEVQESAGQILGSATRAAALTRQLLTFGRQQVMLPEPIDLNDRITGLGSALRQILGEGVTIRMNLHPQTLMTHADEKMLDQVLLNLVSNSRDAMPEGGTLSIDTGQKILTPDDAQTQLDISPGTYVYLRVSDTGCGIPAADLPRIFDPFFSTKDETKGGSGLGLSTVFGIVKQHGGSIAARSVVSQGTTMEVLLPSIEPTESPSTSVERSGRSRGGTETILLVEDEPEVRRLTKTILQRAGYQVLEAALAEEAVKLFTDHQEEIRLLFTDIVMPGGVTGLQLAADLLKRDPKLKVIFTSGYSVDIAGREFTLEEGQNFLQKPFQLKQLLESVRRCLDR